MNANYPIAHELFAELWSSLAGDEVWLDRVRFHGDGALPSAFAVTDFAAATFATAGAAVGELLEAGGWPPSVIDVDRVMASGWFHIFPPGPSQPLSGSQRKGAWQPPAIFADGGPWLTDFETADGRWLRVQGAFATERKRLTKALGTSMDLSEVAAAVRKYPGEEIEQKLVDAKTTVALSRTIAEWLTHPAGRAVHAEPIVHVEAAAADGSSWEPTRGRPLAGIKVLDCTRVVAGPTGTRFLAACGAEVLRLDAPGSDESSGAGGRIPTDLMLGKRWAFLDLRRPEGKARFLELLSETDVFVHTYRPGGSTSLCRFDASGKPVAGDITSQILLWDAGTEVNEEPGLGPNQAPLQPAPHTGPREHGVVRPISEVNDGFHYPSVAEVLQVTITTGLTANR